MFFLSTDEDMHSAYDVIEYGFRHFKRQLPSISDKLSQLQITSAETSNTVELEH